MTKDELKTKQKMISEKVQDLEKAETYLRRLTECTSWKVYQGINLYVRNHAGAALAMLSKSESEIILEQARIIYRNKILSMKTELGITEEDNSDG